MTFPILLAAVGDSGKRHPAGFSDRSYLEAVKATMTAARKAFPRSPYYSAVVLPFISKHR